jgi:hypothetical protein
VCVAGTLFCEWAILAAVDRLDQNNYFLDLGATSATFGARSPRLVSMLTVNRARSRVAIADVCGFRTIGSTVLRWDGYSASTLLDSAAASLRAGTP